MAVVLRGWMPPRVMLCVATDVAQATQSTLQGVKLSMLQNNGGAQVRG